MNKNTVHYTIDEVAINVWDVDQSCLKVVFLYIHLKNLLACNIEHYYAFVVQKYSEELLLAPQKGGKRIEIFPVLCLD